MSISKNKKQHKVIAVDFDGTLCKFDFPRIGKQTKEHKELLKVLIKLKNKGHKLILWTNRGDNKKYPVLSEAVKWCSDKGLEFDAVNENLIEPIFIGHEVEIQKKISGYSPKIMADIYIDDKCLEFGNLISRKKSLKFLKKL